MREAMWISPDQSSGQGRWFWGEYQEFGLDMKMQRATAEPLLITTDKSSLKTGSKAQRVRLIGNSFPLQVTTADLDFGGGVKVTSHRFAYRHADCCGGRCGGRCRTWQA